MTHQSLAPFAPLALSLALTCVCASRAAAQAPPASSAATPVFLPRSDFFFSWAGLRSADPRFTWNSHVGVDLDLVAYRAARLNLFADYEAVLGSENRPFEINHENYAIEALGAYRIRSIEIGGVFHHSSRHLSDRANSSVVAWNIAAVRASRRFALGTSTLDARLEAGRVLQHTFVDYTWKGDLRLTLRRPLGEHTGLFASGAGGFIGVDPEEGGRTGRLCGGRVEAGVRLGGRTAALELFVGYERRIDAYPVDRGRVRWSALGFRFVS